MISHKMSIPEINKIGKFFKKKHNFPALPIDKIHDFDYNIKRNWINPVINQL